MPGRLNDAVAEYREARACSRIPPRRTTIWTCPVPDARVAEGCDCPVRRGGAPEAGLCARLARFGGAGFNREICRAAAAAFREEVRLLPDGSLARQALAAVLQQAGGPFDNGHRHSARDAGPGSAEVRIVVCRNAALVAACALVVGCYAWMGTVCLTEWSLHSPETSHYNLLVEGFQHGQLSLNKTAPPELGQLADPYDPAANARFRQFYVPSYGLHDMSYYKGKL